MAREFEVKIRLTADNQATAEIVGVEKSLGGVETAALSSTKAIAAASVAVAALAAVAKASLVAFSEQEDALVALNAALELRGSGAFEQSLIAQAEALQKVTKFSDEAIESAQALLATYGVAGSSLATATQATVDLSAALGIDLQSAANQVGGAFNGVTRGLEKILPELKSLSEAGFSGAQNMVILADAMEGRAARAAETLSGSFVKAKNSLGEILETVGGVLDEFLNLRGGLEETSKILDFFNGKMKSTSQVFIDLPANIEVCTGSLDGFTAAIDRNQRIADDVGNSISTMAGIAREFGFDLESNVNAQLDANANKLASVEEAYRLGAITTRDYGLAVAALAKQHDALTGAVERNNDATQSTIAQQQQVQAALAATAQQVVFTAQAFEFLARTQGRAVATDAAVAAGGRTILGGTRVLLPGGGSRLTSEPGFNGGRFGG